MYSIKNKNVYFRFCKAIRYITGTMLILTWFKEPNFIAQHSFFASILFAVSAMMFMFTGTFMENYIIKETQKGNVNKDF